MNVFDSVWIRHRDAVASGLYFYLLRNEKIKTQLILGSFREFVNPLYKAVFLHLLSQEGGLYQHLLLNFADLLSIDLKLCMHIANLVIIINR